MRPSPWSWSHEGSLESAWQCHALWSAVLLLCLAGFVIRRFKPYAIFFGGVEWSAREWWLFFNSVPGPSACLLSL